MNNLSFRATYLSFRATYLSFRAKSRNLILLAVIAGLTGNLITSCDKVNVAELQMGQLPDEEVLSSLPAINLRAVSSPDNIVRINLPEGGSFTSVKVYVQASRELDASQTVILSVDEELLEAYNTQNKTDFSLLPAPYYSIDNGGVIDIPAGAKESDEKLVRIYATNPIGNVLEAGNYLLPIKASLGGTIYVQVTVQAPFSGRPDLYTGEDCFTVFYLNTSQFDPRLATDFVVQKLSPSWEVIWHNAIGNIVNFRTVTIDYDAESDRPILNLGSDMRYLCDNFNTYFKPVMDTGRKLCICIEGGNKGIGFCNMTDVQITDFVQQVKQVIEQYGFDGVNLWDRNSGYGKEGFPEMNTTSYPKLIKKLREELGPYKLITLADYAEPTEYFWDVDAMGGIEVGKYLDYAWSGYVNGNEPVQIIDPYHQGEQYVSINYPRKPIIGLSPKRYGCIHTTWYQNHFVYNDVTKWVASGLKNNNISVYYDIRSVLQDKYEGGVYLPDELLSSMDIEGNIYWFNQLNFNINGVNAYGKWLKNW